MALMEERYLVKIGDDYFVIPDEVIDDIRSHERDMIIDFLRTPEWIYELAEDCADAIEELEHYEDDEVH